jgi:hypothetical protein
MAERQMDYTVSRLCGIAESGEVVKRPAVHLGTEGGNGIRCIVRTSHADYFMTGSNEFRDKSGANPSGRTGNENAHDKPPS